MTPETPSPPSEPLVAPDVVTITVDDYHRWPGELYAQVRTQALALQKANAALDARRSD